MLDENVMLDEIEFFVCSTFVQHLEHSNVHTFFIQEVKPTNQNIKTTRWTLQIKPSPQFYCLMFKKFENSFENSKKVG